MLSDDGRINPGNILDIETAEVVDTLRTDIRRVERSLTGEMNRVETSLTARINSVEATLNAKIEHVETSLNGRLEHVGKSLTAKMYELNEDAKRHADVRLESMHHDIRLLAEGVVALSAKVDALRR